MLFSEVGDLKRYSINYDRSGRSKVSTLGSSLKAKSDFFHFAAKNFIFLLGNCRSSLLSTDRCFGSYQEIQQCST